MKGLLFFILCATITTNAVAGGCDWATETPADLLGISNKGRLQTGYDADIVVLNEDLTVDNVIIKGILI